MLHCTSLSVRQPSTYRPRKPPGPATGKRGDRNGLVVPAVSALTGSLGFKVKSEASCLIGKSPPFGKELVPLKGTGSSCGPVLGMTSVWGLACLLCPFRMKDPPQAVTLTLPHLSQGRGGKKKEEEKALPTSAPGQLLPA